MWLLPPSLLLAGESLRAERGARRGDTRLGDDQREEGRAWMGAEAGWMGAKAVWMGAEAGWMGRGSGIGELGQAPSEDRRSPSSASMRRGLAC